jgi:uncharacterized membrane protein
LAFDNENTADQVLNKLAALQKEYLIDFADACVVVRDASGKIHLKQAINLVGTGAASGGAWGAMWGMLVGLLFLNPLAGLLTGGALGAGAGALSGKLADYGINERFHPITGPDDPAGHVGTFRSRQACESRQDPARVAAIQGHRIEDVAFERAGRAA